VSANGNEVGFWADLTFDRRRHVKCDEGKPGCQRCIKWQGHCDGYEGPRAQTKSSDVPKRKKPRPASPENKGEKLRLPRWFRPLAEESRKLVTQAQDVCNEYPAPGVDNSSDSLSQQRSPCCSNSGSGFESGFWQTVVPTLLRSSTSVWCSNLAIHALIDSKQPSWGDEGDEHANACYRRALRYHGLALSQLRNEAKTGGDLESATLCCFFFIIFEMMHGDDKSAQAHMYNGCQMLGELRGDSQGRTLTHADVDTMLHDELQKCLRFIAGQTTGPSQDLFTNPSLGYASFRAMSVTSSEAGSGF